MSTPSIDIIQLLLPFREAMTAPIFRRACTLIRGAILAPGVRTVASCLRAAGLSETKDFANYHRVLSRSPWSAMVVSRILLRLIVSAFVPVGACLRILIDDTLERRSGKKIVYKGLFRDAVRSSSNRTAYAYGIRWLVVCVLVDVPWSDRPWALPFCCVPLLSEKRCQQLGIAHRPQTEWVKALIDKLVRWQPDRKIVVVADGAYASVDLAGYARYRGVSYVSRLRLDACLYDDPDPQPKSKRGPKPKKGNRQSNLSVRLSDPKTVWQRCWLCWYGAKKEQVEYSTGTTLWHTSGCLPVRIRFVLVRSFDDSFKPSALFCQDIDASAEQIIEWFVLRWNIEVTFEEMRACLGFETQRQWSNRAVGRSAPALFAVFSLVVIMAKRLHGDKLPVAHSGWYHKEQATFADALAALRAHLWGAVNYKPCPQSPDLCLIPIALVRALNHAVCYTA